MTVTIRIGTRRSPLALAQTAVVVGSLRRHFPLLNVVLVPMATEGDRHRADPNRRDFTGTIDQALEKGTIDAAIHSSKDLPAQTRNWVEVAAYPRREDPRDCLVLKRRGRLDDLPRGSRIGSSSPRRKAQLLRWRPDLNVVELHGNVETRIARVQEEFVDGAILALAGLKRLGRAAVVDQILPLRRVLPAPGQGALAVETRRGERAVTHLLRALDHRPTRCSVTAERAFTAAMGGDCNLPLGALGTVRSDRLTLQAAVYSSDGKTRLAARLSGPPASGKRIAQRLARTLREKGADQLLSREATRGSLR